MKYMHIEESDIQYLMNLDKCFRDTAVTKLRSLDKCIFCDRVALHMGDRDSGPCCLEHTKDFEVRKHSN